MPGIQLIPLETGRLEADLRIITGEETTATFPVVSWLVIHPNGIVLFDTGLHRSLQDSSDRIGSSARFFVPDYLAGQELTARLAQHGLRPTDVTIIVFSHLHFDHAGGTEEVPDARIVVQAAEWAAGADPEAIDRGIYDPRDYQHGHDVQEIDGNHDLFGDGTVVCVPTPGHTPGHQSLRVLLPSGPIVLTGDCIYYESLYDSMTVPRFGHDGRQQLASMRLLRDMSDDGCRLIFGHDLQQISAIPVGGLQ